MAKDEYLLQHINKYKKVRNKTKRECNKYHLE